MLTWKEKWYYFEYSDVVNRARAIPVHALSGEKSTWRKDNLYHGCHFEVTEDTKDAFSVVEKKVCENLF